MKLLQTLVLGLLTWGIGNPACWAALNFTDGFEGPTLNPFWTVSATNGSITFPSTAKVHSGSQSVQFNSVNTGANKQVYLIHNFATGIYGTFSVWFYDTGAGAASSNHIGIDLHGAANRAHLGALEFGSGLGSNYVYTPDFILSHSSGISRTLAWHNFEIETSPTFVRYSIDGVQVFQENQGLAVSTLYLFMSGPPGRPAWTSYFDDFSVQEAGVNAVPEPSSLLLLAGTGVGICLMRRKQWRHAT